MVLTPPMPEPMVTPMRCASAASILSPESSMACTLAAIPQEPYESALIDGASFWQMFRYITLPLITPFLFIAAMIRMIDAVKSFDIIFAITQGGPGSASETINLYLYSVAFVYYDIGYGSAIALVFFVLIVVLAAVMLYVRQRMHWNEAGGGA